MVLSKGRKFGMEVMVGGKPWREMAPKEGAPEADAFVESSLFVRDVSYNMETVEEDPFGEKFTQAWPVTPYEILLTNKSDALVWFYLYVDGEKAYGSTVAAHGTRLVKGMQGTAGQGDCEERAMLFARPRLVRRGEDEYLAPEQMRELESIRCDFHECTQGKMVAGTSYGAASQYDGVNKAACKKAKAGAMTRTGDVVGKSAAARAGTMLQSYNVKSVLDSVRIRYGQRDKLEKFGVWEDEDEAEDLTAGASGPGGTKRPLG
mmetsp:Transcript_12306/g.36581  ORF Transcript_12306/g.36581 Transcript_12306/m.36581 type:complete len:262 (-) Transcript_12306:36-821(-)